MPNSYYTHTTYPSTNSPGASSSARAEFDAIMAGFNLLPTALGAGRNGFDGGDWEDPTITGGTIDNTVIGSEEAAAASFTTVSASGAATLSGGGNVSGAFTGVNTNDANGDPTVLATLENVELGKVTPAPAAVTTLSVVDDANLEGELTVTKDASVTGTLTVSGATSLQAGGTLKGAFVGQNSNDSDGNPTVAPTLDGVAIGTVAPAQVAATTLSASDAVDFEGGGTIKGNPSFPDGITFPDGSMQSSGAGQIIYTAASTPDPGYIKANGAELSRSAYAALFARVGTTYGEGDGSTTFNVPDGRGIFPRGWADDGSIDAGRAFGSLQEDAYASHDHPVTDPTHTHPVDDPSHGHAVADPTHLHGVSDPTHAHIQDGGVWYDSAQYTFSTGGGGQIGTGTVATAYAGTGIGVAANYTSIGIYGSYTGITNAASVTGITVKASGDVETRPKNIAWLCCIKY